MRAMPPICFCLCAFAFYLPIFLLPTGCANRPHDIAVVASVRGRSDEATVTNSADGTVVTVMNPTGIGGVRIQRQGASWPRLLTVHLAYSNDKEFRTLQSLIVRSGEMQARTSGPGAQDVSFFGSISAEYRGTYRINMECRARYMQIVFPQDFLHKAGETIELEWIDQR